MRLIPAHMREAKDMAKDLKQALDNLGFTIDCRNPDAPPPPLQQVQEFMAQAMGYPSGWIELRKEVEQPHAPIYLDCIENAAENQIREKLVTKLSGLLGYDYPYGRVWDALDIAGVGCSPKFRRDLYDRATPWGVIEESWEIADGIRQVITSGHGGWVVTQERQQRMPSHLRLEEPFYEEDIDCGLVALAFPEELEEHVADALSRVDLLDSSSVPRIRDNTPEHEKFLSEVMVSYIPPEQDPMNRPMTDLESAVVRFLGNCVYLNRPPSVQPSSLTPTLQEWVNVLVSVPHLNYRWPMKDTQWKPHWGQWRRMDEVDEEINATLGQFLKDAKRIDPDGSAT